MEIRTPLSIRTDITPQANLSMRGTGFKKLFYGNSLPEAVKPVVVHPNTALHHEELKRLNDMKSNFVLIAAGNFKKPSFLLDKVWASAKAFSKFLKSSRLK